MMVMQHGYESYMPTDHWLVAVHTILVDPVMFSESCQVDSWVIVRFMGY